MAGISFRKNILPHLIAILVFIISTIIFYSPIYFDNKEISQHDILQGIGGGQEIVEYRERTGEEALWTNSMFSGMPAYLINTQWSGDLLTPVQNIITLGLPGSSKFTFLAMICFYVMLMAFKVPPYLAIAGALGFGFTSFNLIGIMAGHIWRIVAIAYMPLVIAGIHLTFKGKIITGFVLTSLALGLEIKANHLQMTYYLLLIVLIYGLTTLIYAIKERTIKTFILRSLIIIAAAIIAVGANFGKLWATYEYSQYSMRGPSEIKSTIGDENGLEREYAFRYSNGIFEPFVLFIPNFLGGSSQQALDPDSHLGNALKQNTGMTDRQLEGQLGAIPTYWGKQPLTAPYYAGSILVFLFIIGVLNVKRPIKYWLIACIILGIVLSWGHNFALVNYFLFDYFPGYDKFRSVTFTIILSIIGIQTLGILGIRNWLQLQSVKKRNKQLVTAASITAGFLVFIIIISGFLNYRGPIDDQLAGNVPEWFISALREDRKSLLRSDAIRNLFLISISFGLLWALANKKINRNLSLGLLIILIYFDLATVGSRFINKESYKSHPVREYFTKTEADASMLADTGHFRVLNLNNPFNEARTSYFHSSVGGYHGAKMRRYQDLIDACISNEIAVLINNIRSGTRDFDDLNVLNLLNTKFFYAGDRKEYVFKNEAAFGNAWLVSQVQKVGSASEELAMVCNVTRTGAIVDTTKFDLLQNHYDTTGTIGLTEYQPGKLTYEAHLNGNSLIVFSEVYYPAGWEALVNGQPQDFIRANYILRAMELPAGNHTVTFTFKPKAYHVGNQVMFASSLLIILLIMGSIAYEFRILIKQNETKS